MTIHTPGYYDRFRCLAGECPHTCCAGWEVPIDRSTAGRYRTIPGQLGERLRSAMEETSPGEISFRLHGENCPFLNEKGLCEIHIRLGEAATGEICRTHPRFSYHYGPVNEVGLCASCPQAARLILENDMILTSSRDDRPGEDAPALLEALLTARETALGLLGVAEATLGQRLQAMLLFANEVQVLVEEDRTEDIPQLCAVYGAEFPLIDPEALPGCQAVMKEILTLLGRLHILRPGWRALLAAGQERWCQKTAPFVIPSQEGARMAAYFLYRHWLRGVWDGDVLTWAEFAVVGVAVAAHLAPLHPEGFSGAFRQFCEELEHNEGNMETIQEALWEIPFPQMLALAKLGYTPDSPDEG